ncbi:hypothetical protein H4R99_002544 [Coemansia sp. RSA 1722]|nr:hypothetical protein IWW45_001747 [Coemansia sp. RSA 485]KAJ2602867.1 hypothetical protein H4R99_002544 [Coemansia sp. RSA 1722]
MSAIYKKGHARKPNGFGICYESLDKSGCISFLNGRCVYSIINDQVQPKCNPSAHPRLIDSNPKAPKWDISDSDKYNITYSYVVHGIDDVDASSCCGKQVGILLVLSVILAFLLVFANKFK